MGIGAVAAVARAKSRGPQGKVAFLLTLANELAQSARAQNQDCMSSMLVDGTLSHVQVPVSQDAAAQHALGILLIRAMISAAKADGQVDAQETRRIFYEMSAQKLSQAEKTFLMEEISKPIEVDALAAEAQALQQAAQVYAASVIVIEAPTPQETDYLQALAQKLGLEHGLVTEIHQKVQAAAALGTEIHQQGQAVAAPPAAVGGVLDTAKAAQDNAGAQRSPLLQPRFGINLYEQFHYNARHTRD
jgi:uncharacterized membrane protein YebE (DUF533 family)